MFLTFLKHTLPPEEREMKGVFIYFLLCNCVSMIDSIKKTC